MSVATKELVWRPCRTPIALPKMQACIDQWMGTPYMAGQRSCQQGVDCVRWAEAFYETMFEYEDYFECERVPQDASVHSRRTVLRVMAQLLRRYPHEIDVCDEVEPGDIVIINQGKGPGHTAIVGTGRNEVIHALPGVGICMSGIGYINSLDIAHTIHALGKDKWL